MHKIKESSIGCHITRIRTFGGLVVAVSLACAVQARAQGTEIPRKLTLKDAVNLAIRNSRDLALARAEYGVEEREASVNGSAFRPNFYTGTGAAYTSGFPLMSGGGVPAVFSLDYEQQIFNPPLKGEQRAAEQKAEGQRLGVEGVRDGVIVKAALEYLELAKVRHGIDLMHEERLSATHILDAMRERVAAGQELPIEVTRAQLSAARIDQHIAQLEDREDTLTGDMRDMMGLPADTPIEVTAEDLPSAASDDTKDVVALALANNVELKQADTDRLASEEKLKGQRGGYWPTFSLTGQYNVLSKINDYTNYFNKFTRNNVIFGLEVRIPIFASRTSAAVAFAKADLETANLTLEKKRSELTLDVRRMARQVHEADLGTNVARLELQLAQENLGVLQAQFDQGRGSLKDLEAAHIDENDKWLAYLDANYARQQAQLELLRSTGEVASVLQ